MSKEQNRIVNALLDKYEKSVRFTENREVAKKVSLNFYNNGKSDFPPYDIENDEAHAAYNQAAEELCVSGIIGRDWMKGQRGHLIARVWLELEQIERAYELVCRTPKADTLDVVDALLTAALERAGAEWEKHYLTDCLARVRGRKSLSDWLPSDAPEIEGLLKVLSAAAKVGEAETLERLFSTRVLGNSKLFERKYRGWLIKIVRNYGLEGVEDVTDEEVLSQVGIIKYPEKISFCGGLTAVFGGLAVDFAPIPCGLSVDIAALLDAELAVTAQKILLIENKANYIDYLARREANELVIFHGGCYGPIKGRLLKKLAECAPGVCVAHWGDIDWGGFSMLARLRRNIFPTLQCYRMNEQELLRYAQSTLPITDHRYRDRLLQLLDDELLQDCRICLHYMVQKCVKLEQEAMI